eukprot:TRINITY_DN33204_c0_g1_i1.p2 TRINITY_DN33204_c0_g1~~TRINITY_DN33204_c0_g1_i1.p2  ORF type:complete len:248 (+),score=27.63 TRINITY_DN33204_c0_g1_i1:758-1501(+)
MADTPLPAFPCCCLLVSIGFTPPLLYSFLCSTPLLHLPFSSCSVLALHRRISRLAHGDLRRLPLLRLRQHLPLRRLPPLGHGAADARLRHRLVHRPHRPRRRLRPRHPPQLRRADAQEAGELRPSRRPGSAEEDDPRHLEDGWDRRGSGVCNVSGGRSETAAVFGQLLRRGGVGGLSAYSGEGVRSPVGGSGGGEGEGVGGGGEGVEAGWGGGGLGPGVRAGVCGEAERAEDGGDTRVGTGYGVYGE